MPIFIALFRLLCVLYTMSKKKKVLAKILVINLKDFLKKVHPSLDIVNRPVRPLSFTISSRLLYQVKLKMKLSSITMPKMLLNWHRSKVHSR